MLVSPISAVQAIDVLTLNQNIPLHPLNIPYANGQITIDGELDDNLWSNALPIELSIVNNPWNNLASPIKTTAKLIENGKFLYVAFVADDPTPENIQGFFSPTVTMLGLMI